MIRFAVHVHPGSRQRRVGGSYDGALSVHVTSRALEGAATRETLAVLADAFDVRPGVVHFVRGVRSRTKLITIEGDDGQLQRRLDELLGETNG